ncbi:MAG: hypothetical protein ACK5QX_00180 [bacterium]
MFAVVPSAVVAPATAIHTARPTAGRRKRAVANEVRRQHVTGPSAARQDRAVPHAVPRNVERVPSDPVEVTIVAGDAVQRVHLVRKDRTHPRRRDEVSVVALLMLPHGMPRHAVGHRHREHLVAPRPRADERLRVARHQVPRERLADGIRDSPLGPKALRRRVDGRLDARVRGRDRLHMRAESLVPALGLEDQRGRRIRILRVVLVRQREDPRLRARSRHQRVVGSNQPHRFRAILNAARAPINAVHGRSEVEQPRLFRVCRVRRLTPSLQHGERKRRVVRCRAGHRQHAAKQHCNGTAGRRRGRRRSGSRRGSRSGGRGGSRCRRGRRRCGHVPGRADDGARNVPRGGLPRFLGRGMLRHLHSAAHDAPERLARDFHYVSRSGQSIFGDRRASRQARRDAVTAHDGRRDCAFVQNLSGTA